MTSLYQTDNELCKPAAPILFFLGMAAWLTGKLKPR
jgi:hypothetical protein